MDNSILITLLALVLCAALGMFSYCQHTKPHEKLNPRMMPWSLIAMGCLATSFMIVVHLVNLLGFETGRR